ncbi:MAG: T9SS type A sorting domain-containing protein, partial [Flavobacteriales bacterium]|nr:T9SS type A sorting domain-containing protein [Flavobacteriales bacterium]
SDNFLELAFVEVSSDGINFFRFPATSEIQDTLQTDGFGSSDPTEINNLAGKYRAQYGTPFDLEELIGTNGLDINHITHVRVIDVIGSISENYASYDQYGNAINDPYPTDFPAGGFDLDAVGVINHDISASIGTSNKDFKLYPALTSDLINLTSHSIIGEISIYSIDGTLINKLQSNDYSLTIDVNFLESGIYLLNTNGINLQFIKY